MQELDCRGLNCPQPVINTKALVDQGLNEFKVRVDNQAASENVTNFLGTQGYQVEMEKEGAEFVLHGRRDGQADQAPAGAEEFDPSLYQCPVPTQEQTKICVLIATDRIGRGDDELGRKLMASYLSTLKEMGPELWRLVLLNAGVKLAVEGADSVEALKELEQSGVSILVCGTCLTFFDLLEAKVVGETTNMLDVVTSLQVADKTIDLS